jgi:hypothetical protein
MIPAAAMPGTIRPPGMARTKPFKLTPELVAAFWQRVHKGSEDECWQWMGSIQPSGYGRLYAQRRGLLPHRVSVLIDGRTIPDGFVVDHKCMNRACVNPRHLRVVTLRENALENSGSMSARYAQRTHCDRGHEYTRENTMLLVGEKKFERRCRECQKERERRFHAKRRAQSIVGERDD